MTSVPSTRGADAGLLFCGRRKLQQERFDPHPVHSTMGSPSYAQEDLSVAVLIEGRNTPVRPDEVLEDGQTLAEQRGSPSRQVRHPNDAYPVTYADPLTIAINCPQTSNICLQPNQGLAAGPTPARSALQRKRHETINRSTSVSLVPPLRFVLSHYFELWTMGLSLSRKQAQWEGSQDPISQHPPLPGGGEGGGEGAETRTVPATRHPQPSPLPSRERERKELNLRQGDSHIGQPSRGQALGLGLDFELWTLGS